MMRAHRFPRQAVLQECHRRQTALRWPLQATGQSCLRVDRESESFSLGLMFTRPPFCLSLQLLGDYDKVKAVSEGSDCQCKCVVRPLGRDACQRVNEGAARKEDFYTVETVTSGPSCKCACIAPPSALNPCEGDFRLQKLREADSRDLKVGPEVEGATPCKRATQGPVWLTGPGSQAWSRWTCCGL